MKNENNFIRESQRQPGNNYQHEHKEHRRVGSPARDHRVVHRLWPGYSLSRRTISPIFLTVALFEIVATLKGAGEYHIQYNSVMRHSTATSRLEAEYELCLRYHSAYFFTGLCH